MEYSKFISLARKYKSEQADNEALFLELLVEQETDILNWKAPRTPHHNWSDLIREEGLCTISTYTNYKKARSILTRAWIDRFGVYASISIAKLNSDVRPKILSKVKAWYNHHKVPPTYQRISKYVRDLGAVKRKSSTRTQKMKAYIRKCQALLKRNGIPVPVFKLS